MPTTLEMAKDLTLALVQSGRLDAGDMDGVLKSTYAKLKELEHAEHNGNSTTQETITPPVDWRRSISKHSIMCLECGTAFKQLSRRHLLLHDLDGRTYRLKYHIPKTQPLASRSTTARRRETVQMARPWEHTPTYAKRMANAEAQATEPEAEPKRTGRKKATAKAS